MFSTCRWAATAAVALGWIVGCRQLDAALIEGDAASGAGPALPPKGESPSGLPSPVGTRSVGSNFAEPLTASTGGAQSLVPATALAPMSFAPIAKHADPSVVTVLTQGTEIESSFLGRVRRQTHGLGTGFIVDGDGIILTNNHVIKEADAINVKLSNDKLYPARVVGKDSRTDIAVLKIEEHGLTPLALGDSDAIEVGDWVVAIGNPYELSHTVSVGILSAKGRTKEDVPLDPTGYYSFLQTDASINLGNSGGPLLNLKGEVVGINTAVKGGISPEGVVPQGISFAIPINMVKQLLPMLLRDGHVTRSALGIGLFDDRKLTQEDRAALKLTTGHEAIVEWVEPGGPADRAHIAQYDVILSFDGTPIDKSTLLQWLASTAGVGKTVTLKVSRDGKVFETKVTLGQLAESPRAGR
jgi:serine protease Do